MLLFHRGAEETRGTIRSMMKNHPRPLLKWNQGQVDQISLPKTVIWSSPFLKIVGNHMKKKNAHIIMVNVLNYTWWYSVRNKLLFKLFEDDFIHDFFWIDCMMNTFWLWSLFIFKRAKFCMNRHTRNRCSCCFINMETTSSYIVGAKRKPHYTISLREHVILICIASYML